MLRSNFSTSPAMRFFASSRGILRLTDGVGFQMEVYRMRMKKSICFLAGQWLYAALKTKAPPKGAQWLENYSISTATLTGNLSMSSSGEVFWT